MMEEKFESDEMKAEVIKLLCSGQDGSQTSKSENSIQNPPLRYDTVLVFEVCKITHPLI